MAIECATRRKTVKMSMHAAVVRSFDRPPRYEDYESPEPVGPNETLVDVLAVGLHPRVRSGASGQHYTSTGELPMIPGIDGVGKLPDGRRVYFVVSDDAWGAMAEQAVVDLRRVVELPEDIDAISVAATMNPAMSSWVALRRRVPLIPGQSVLVLGATGNAGSMAVRVAKHLGAGRIVAAGRNQERLDALLTSGADEVVVLVDDPLVTAEHLARAAADVDVVIDYLWGEPASRTMRTLLEARTDRSAALDWIQIGAVAGPTIELPSVLLRSANFRIQGNGQGAVSPRAYVAELPSLVSEIAAGSISINTVTVPLSDVESAWSAPQAPGVRTVFLP
jgi:NADPH:quinone reductase-like Zn-dependent oxidoreductase